ncbi:hypothetical protein PAPYR_4605 [Paratrimastix pyriformis]|uniref:Uncharacterized protein n=1 Tax=Paratrimastix pyriformis TaxID=342808 RepID=A0ABQ8UJZ2_9EUKA|nr:hypothetical protein PAPYR_4605 [Paratrimastix pyriformis]
MQHNRDLLMRGRSTLRPPPGPPGSHLPTFRLPLYPLSRASTPHHLACEDPRHRLHSSPASLLLQSPVGQPWGQPVTVTVGGRQASPVKVQGPQAALASAAAPDAEKKPAKRFIPGAPVWGWPLWCCASYQTNTRSRGSGVVPEPRGLGAEVEYDDDAEH